MEVARRTWRSIGCSIVVRPFNSWVEQNLQKKETDKVKRDEIMCVQSSKRIELFNLYCNDFRRKVIETMVNVSSEKYKTVYKSIENSDSKVSTQGDQQ